LSPFFFLKCAVTCASQRSPWNRSRRSRPHVIYLDVTARIEGGWNRGARSTKRPARANIVLWPCFGFDVIPTIAWPALKRGHCRMPSVLKPSGSNPVPASRLVRQDDPRGMGAGTRSGAGGVLLTEPIGLRRRHSIFVNGMRLRSAFPWGDVSTAYQNTGSPSITVLSRWRPSFRLAMLVREPGRSAAPLPAITRTGSKSACRASSGPDGDDPQNAPTFVWWEGAIIHRVAMRTARIVPQTATM